MEAARSKTVKRTATPAPVPAAHPVRATGSPGRVQLKSALKVSSPSDPAEREAEATARKIVQLPLQSPYVSRFQDAVGAAGPGLTVARKEEGPPNVSSNAASEISASAASGSPLPPGVRGFMEPRFGADFGSVRVHTDDRAAGLSRQLNAQAFTVGNQIFFGRNRFQPESEKGRELLAHELTHTIQQGAAVQRSADVPVTQQSPPQVQRLGVSDALDYFADRANNIPGFRMFTIILGVNPLNMRSVERSAANILRAVVEILPGGALITQALDNHGVFDRVGNWVEQQIRTLGMTGSVIRNAIDRFLDSLSWRDVFNLGGVWERARLIFTEPIDRIISFATGLVGGIIRFIKDAILQPLARLAEGTRGYDLLKAVLGRDPVTGDPVPRNAQTLIGGFMRLIGQEEIWQNLQRSGAVARAWSWFQGALSGLMGFVQQIPSLFVQAFRSLEIADIILVPRAFAKIASVFGGFIGQFFSWAGSTIWNLLEIIFSVVAPGVMVYLRRAAGAFRTILRNPIGFVGNLVRAGLLGLRQFAANFLTHLRASLIGWLTGAMSGANIYIPQGFNLREILKFVLSVLGLTWQNIRGKLVRAIGETAVRVLETGFDLVVTLVTQGPAAAWEKIQESLSNLREMVMEQVMTFVRERVVQAAITRLVTSLNPAGAFIQAVIAIYNTVMFFIERLRQIAQVAMSFIDSISAIASGSLSAAASRVEQTMAGLLTLVISFLARIAGLGRVSDAVINVVNRVRQPIDRALDRVVDWIVATARRLGRLIVGAVRGRDTRTPEEKQRDLDRAVRELRPRVEPLLRRGIPRPLLTARLWLWRTQYRLSSLTIEGGRIQAAINPVATMYTAEEIAIGRALEPLLVQAERFFLNNIRRRTQGARAGRLQAARTAWQGGGPAPAALSPAELALVYRQARAGQINMASTRAPVVQQSGFSIELTTWRGSRPLGTGVYIPQAGPYADEHLPGMPAPGTPGATYGQRTTANWPTSVNREWEMRGETPGAWGLRSHGETMRAPGSLAPFHAAEMMANAGGIRLIAGNDPRARAGQSPEVTRAEVAHGLMAGMATGGSAGAAEAALFANPNQPNQPVQPWHQDATDVRHGSYGVIFQTLREALLSDGMRLLALPGGAALASLGQAFQQWLDVAVQGTQIQQGPQVDAAARTLRARLIMFLRSQQPAG